MHNNHVPLKVAIGYCTVAIVLVLAIALVYSNTKSILAINKASQEYVKKRDDADCTMSYLLKEEQANLRQLADAMEGKNEMGYLSDKVRSLNNGKDSIVVHPKTQQTHQDKNTTVEVVKTKKGFFRRLADAFKKEHAETLSITRDSNRAIIDSVTTPVNVAENVASILRQIEKKEKKSSKNHSETISKEMEELQMVNAQLALRSAQQLNDIHQRERDAMQQAIDKAMEARQHLLWQIGLLAIIAIIAAIILLWYIWRDTKKERIYRENLENANEEINRIMQQRERLLLTITHDIKAPAASISGFIDLMGDYVKDEQGKKCLANIKSSTNHLSHLVASLLDYHQLENGLMKVHPCNFNPSQLVAQCVEALRPLAESKGLLLTFDIQAPTSENIPQGKEAHLYRSDAFRIQQILNNLLSNAIKYTDKGSVHVTATITSGSKNGYSSEKKHQLTLSVKDTGKGMTQAEAQKVFQAFTRLKSAQGIEGTGLGLSITHELASLLGGDIQLSSAEGKGSTFTVVIPLQTATGEDSNPSISPTQGKTSRHLSTKEERKPSLDVLANHKILILDDDNLQLQLLQEMLRRLVDSSWEVISCNHVTDALTALHNERPTIMLMDIEMPEMNGMEMIKHINHAQMKVIAMTAHDPSILSDLKKAGFDDCLFKPFHIEKLKNILGIEQTETKGNAPNNANHRPINMRFKSLLAFAEDDEEAAKDILGTVRQELEKHLQNLQEAIQKEEMPLDTIGMAAHKLLPIATMTQMDSIEQLKALAPESIHKMKNSQIRGYVQVIITDLQGVLKEM